MKKSTRIIPTLCIMFMLCIGAMFTSKAGTYTFNRNISNFDHAVLNTSKTTNTKKTNTTAYIQGAVDVLSVKVSDQSTQQIQKHPIISVTEGTSASANYYSTASGFAGIGIRVDVYPRDTNLLPFKINTYVDYH